MKEPMYTTTVGRGMSRNRQTHVVQLGPLRLDYHEYYRQANAALRSVSNASTRAWVIALAVLAAVLLILLIGRSSYFRRTASDYSGAATMHAESRAPSGVLLDASSEETSDNLHDSPPPPGDTNDVFDNLNIIPPAFQEVINPLIRHVFRRYGDTEEERVTMMREFMKGLQCAQLAQAGLDELPDECKSLTPMQKNAQKHASLSMNVIASGGNFGPMLQALLPKLLKRVATSSGLASNLAGGGGTLKDVAHMSTLLQTLQAAPSLADASKLTELTTLLLPLIGDMIDWEDMMPLVLSMVPSGKPEKIANLLEIASHSAGVNVPAVITTIAAEYIAHVASHLKALQVRRRPDAILIGLRVASVELFERWLLAEQCWKLRAVADYLIEQSGPGSGETLFRHAARMDWLPLIFEPLNAEEMAQPLDAPEHFSLAIILARHRNGGWSSCVDGPIDDLLEHLFGVLNRTETSTTYIDDEAIAHYLERNGGASPPLDERYMLVERQRCTRLRPTIVLGVRTAPDDFAARRLVRSTWGSWATRPLEKHRAILVFVSGRAPSDAQQQALDEEYRRDGDIVQVDFDASNRVLQSLQLLRWLADLCPAASHLVTADSHTFVNVPALLREIDAASHAPLAIVGHLHHKRHPKRAPVARQHVPRHTYPLELYPTFAYGSVAIYPRPLVERLLTAARRTPVVVPLDDVFVSGLVAAKAQVPRRHLESIAFPRLLHLRPSACSALSTVAVEQLSEPEVKRLWHEFLLLESGALVCNAQDDIVTIRE